jgi:hypothetical protein
MEREMLELGSRLSKWQAEILGSRQWTGFFPSRSQGGEIPGEFQDALLIYLVMNRDGVNVGQGRDEQPLVNLLQSEVLMKSYNYQALCLWHLRIRLNFPILSEATVIKGSFCT